MAEVNPTIIPLPPLTSDGDISRVPRGSNYHRAPNTFDNWHILLGREFMNSRGNGDLSIEYCFDKFPDGYVILERSRRAEPRVDRYIFGHPSGRYFDSASKFFPHLLHLVDPDSNPVCTCICCTRPPPMAPSTVPNPQHKHQKAPSFTRDLVREFRASGKATQRIEQPNNPDWLALQQQKSDDIALINRLPPFSPRIAEMVIFLRDVPESAELFYDHDEQKFFVRDHSTNKQYKPNWEAGVVIQVPEDQVTLDDLVRDSDKKRALNYSGYKIQKMSDPNSIYQGPNRVFHHYPLHHIRPFTYHQKFLRGLSINEYPLSIKHALIAASFVSLWNPTRMLSQAEENLVILYSGGVFVGWEFIKKGDIITFFHPDKNRTDVMRVTSIATLFADMEQSNERFSVQLMGDVWTQDDSVQVDESNPPPAALDGYEGGFFPAVSSTRGVIIKVQQVIGRVHGAPAQSLWFPSPSTAGAEARPKIDAGIDGVEAGRRFGRKHNPALHNIDDPLLWHEDRVTALGVSTLAGIPALYK